MTAENVFVSTKDMREAFSRILGRITEEGFPLLRRTVSIVKNVHYDRDASIKALAADIMADPGMSARILRIANSPLLNPGIYRIRTVTRALVMIGLKNVISLALSTAVLEDVMTREQAAIVFPRLVRALKRAMHARQLALLAGDNVSEEAFLAGLLYDLGNLVFDAFVPVELQRKIRDIALRDDIPVETVRRRLLGFDAREVTLKLNKSWKISPLLEDVLTPGKESQRTKYITTADKIVEFLDKHDLDAPESAEFFRELASELGISVKSLEESVRTAERLSETFEKEYSRLPDKEDVRFAEEKPQDIESVQDLEKPGELITAEADRLKELMGIIQDIVAMMYRGFTDPHVLFSLVLEAIFSGLQMDFVCFGLLTAEKNAFRIRYSLMRKGVDVKLPEVILLKNKEKNLFYHILFQDSALWITQNSDPEMLARANSPPASSFVSIPCMIMPIRPKNTTIGFIYADMRKQPEKMNNETFSMFTMFGQFATIGLSFLVSHNRLDK